MAISDGPSKKSRTQIHADGLREASVLIAVFGPMYSLFDTQPTDNWHLVGRIVGWIFFGYLGFHLSIELERRIE